MTPRSLRLLAAVVCLALLPTTTALARGGSGGGGATAPPPTTSTLTIDAQGLPPATVGQNYGGFITATGGRGTPYRWRVIAGRVPVGLAFASAFGVQSTVISGTPTTVGTSTFTVQVQDGAGATATRSFSITVSPPAPLAINNESDTLLPGTVGSSYNANLFPSGGVPPYRWSVASGALPPGLTLSGQGSISGTPSTPGTFIFAVRLGDSAGASTTRTFSIAVS